MIFIEGIRSGKTVEYLFQYIINNIEETKSNDFWEFNLSSKEFDRILMNNISVDDKLFFAILKEKISKIIDGDVKICWSENMRERCKTLNIKKETDLERVKVKCKND